MNSAIRLTANRLPEHHENTLFDAIERTQANQLPDQSLWQRAAAAFGHTPAPALTIPVYPITLTPSDWTFAEIYPTREASR
jgi:hypothetical protein